MTEDKRPFYKVKTNYGVAAFVILIILHAAGIDLPYTQIAQFVTVWTGYSIADRFRNKPN